jgi:hypothetical protein
LSSNDFEFEFKVDGWQGFHFAKNLSEAKKILEERCDSIESYLGDYNGRGCGTWLSLDIDISIGADKAYIPGFSRKLSWINISMNFSDFAANKILDHLKSNFKLTSDDICPSIKEGARICSMFFNYGDVIFYDSMLVGNRTISVIIHPL